MKYSMHVLLFVVLQLSMTSMFAQDTSSRLKNNLKISPFEFGMSEFQVSYERFFANNKSSVVISPMIILRDTEEDIREGFQINAQYRYYLTDLNVENGNQFWGLYNIGFYSGVYGQYLQYNDEYEINYWDNETGSQNNIIQKRDITSNEGGLIMGMQVNFTKNILMDFFAGGGLRFTETDEAVLLPDDAYDAQSDGVFSYGFRGVKPTVGFMIGISF